MPLESPQQVYDLLLPFPNAALEAAKRAFLEKHPLAKDKEQAALLKVDPFKGGKRRWHRTVPYRTVNHGF